AAVALLRRPDRQAGHGFHPGGAGGPGAARLAGQPPGVAQRRRAGRDPGGWPRGRRERPACAAWRPAGQAGRGRRGRGAERGEGGGAVTLDELEAEHIRRVLAAAVSLDEAAQTLGIDPSTLYRKRKRYGL